MNSKQCDAYYGVKPRNVEHKAEELPKSPAKKPYPGYCKRLKSEHIFTLFDVQVYPGHDWVGRVWLVTEYLRHKEYRCESCGKKKWVLENVRLDEPVRKLAWV